MHPWMVLILCFIANLSHELALFLPASKDREWVSWHLRPCIWDSWQSASAREGPVLGPGQLFENPHSLPPFRERHTDRQMEGESDVSSGSQSNFSRLPPLRSEDQKLHKRGQREEVDLDIEGEWAWAQLNDRLYSTSQWLSLTRPKTTRRKELGGDTNLATFRWSVAERVRNVLDGFSCSVRTKDDRAGILTLGVLHPIRLPKNGRSCSSAALARAGLINLT